MLSEDKRKTKYTHHELDKKSQNFEKHTVLKKIKYNILKFKDWRCSSVTDRFFWQTPSPRFIFSPSTEKLK